MIDPFDGKVYIAQNDLPLDGLAPHADSTNWTPVSTEPDGKSTLDTESTAGAGQGNIGIAGSLALTIADFETHADLLPTNGDNLKGGDITQSATSSVDTTDKAMASDKEAGTVGIGAGAAIGIVDDVTTAIIESGAIINDGVPADNPGKIEPLTATGTDSITTYAEAGATGTSKSTLSLTADAAIALPTVTTTAAIQGAGPLQATTASSAVTLTATQTAKSTTTAKADAVNGSVVIGLALGLAVPDDEVTATNSRTLTAKSLTLTATGSQANTNEADASATGAQGKDSGSSTDSSGKGRQHQGQRPASERELREHQQHRQELDHH